VFQVVSAGSGGGWGICLIEGDTFSLDLTCTCPTTKDHPQLGGNGHRPQPQTTSGWRRSGCYWKHEGVWGRPGEGEWETGAATAAMVLCARVSWEEVLFLGHGLFSTNLVVFLASIFHLWVVEKHVISETKHYNDLLYH
jgi:hypothetical protein